MLTVEPAQIRHLISDRYSGTAAGVFAVAAARLAQPAARRIVIFYIPGRSYRVALHAACFTGPRQLADTGPDERVFFDAEGYSSFREIAERLRLDGEIIECAEFASEEETIRRFEAVNPNAATLERLVNAATMCVVALEHALELELCEVA